MLRILRPLFAQDCQARDNPAMTVATQQALAASEWFSDLTPAVVEKLAALARRRKLADGGLLFVKGDAADGLYGVVSGRIRVVATAADGKELLVNLYEPGGWFGEISMFDGLPRTHDAFAVGATELLLIPREKFLALLTQQPELYPHFLQMLCKKLRRSFSWIEYVAFMPLPTRLAARLLELAQAYGKPVTDGVLIDLHLPQEDLGRMLNASRQSVSKELNQLEARGLIRIEYGRVLIRDKAALKAQISTGS